MIAARKLTFQLASLLDLLLIVMFAQYLEMQTVAQQESERVEAERQAATTSLDALQLQLKEVQRQLSELEDSQRELDQAEQANRENLGRVFGELFRIPESTIQKLSRQRSQDDVGLTPADVEALKKEFQSLAKARGDEVVDHLLTFTEMKKRFDVWEVYLQENGALLVTSGSNKKRLQTGTIETPEQFSDELFRLYKTFPQTKNVVLILASYGDARFVHRLSVVKGLPLAAERMRADSNGQARFEYAILGFRPEAVP